MSDRTRSYPQNILVERARLKLEEAGASAEIAGAAAKAMLHASRLGIDSHGFHLTSAYCRMIDLGQVNPRPDMKVMRTGPATALIDAGNGLGHHPSYAAIKLACEMAKEAGIGAAG